MRLTERLADAVRCLWGLTDLLPPLDVVVAALFDFAVRMARPLTARRPRRTPPGRRSSATGRRSCLSHRRRARAAAWRCVILRALTGSFAIFG